MKIELAIAAAALGLASAMQASAGILPRVGLGNMNEKRIRARSVELRSLI